MSTFKKNIKFSVAENEIMLSTDKNYLIKKNMKMKEQEKETGESILMLG